MVSSCLYLRRISWPFMISSVSSSLNSVWSTSSPFRPIIQHSPGALSSPRYICLAGSQMKLMYIMPPGFRTLSISSTAFLVSFFERWMLLLNEYTQVKDSLGNLRSNIFPWIMFKSMLCFFSYSFDASIWLVDISIPVVLNPYS